MASAGTVTVDFAAEVAKFNAQLKQVSSAVKNLETGFATFGRTVSTAFQFLSGAALVGFAKQALTAADAIGDAAHRAGTSVEAFSRLKFAAEQNDIEFGSLEVAIRKFQDTMAEAAHGSQQAADAFNELGISAESLKGKDLETQLGIIADRFKEIQDPADKVRIAIDLFGRSGNELVPLLEKGSAGLKELGIQAEKLGVVLDTNAAEAIDKAEKRLKTLGDQATIAAAKILELLSITFGGAPDEQNRLEDQIRLLEIQKQRIETLFKARNADPSVALKATNDELERLVALQRQQLGLENDSITAIRIRKEALDQINADLASSVVVPTFQIALTPEEEAKQLQQIAETLDKVNQLKRDALEQAFQFEFQLRQDAAASLDAVDQEANQFAQQRIKERSDAIVEGERLVRQQKILTLNLTVGLLQTFAGRSKAAAIAAIALGKALSIAQTIQNTAAAVMKAFTIDPTGALAARISLIGKVQIGIIAATGLGEIAQVGSGGAALGTPGNPVFTGGGAANEDQIPGATGQSVTQIIINGTVLSTQETAAWLIDQITDAIDNRDVIVVSPNSRNGQELMGG